MNDGLWAGVLISAVLMLAFLGISYPFVEPGTATSVVLKLSAIHLVAAITIISGLLYFDWDPFEPLR